MAQFSAKSNSDPIIGRKITDLQKAGVKVEDFNPIGMKIQDIAAQGNQVSDLMDVNQAIRDAQAAKFPTSAEQGGKPGSITAPPAYLESPVMQGWLKAKEQLGYVNRGVMAGIPNAIVGVKDALNRSLRDPTTVLNEANNLARGMTDPLKTLGKQAIELVKPGSVNAPSPDAPETQQMAEAAGANLAVMAGGPVIGKVAPPMIRGVAAPIRRQLVPATLRAGAAASREAAAAGRGAQFPMNAATLPMTLARASVKPLRLAKASFQERLADWLSTPAQRLRTPAAMAAAAEDEAIRAVNFANPPEQPASWQELVEQGRARDYQPPRSLPPTNAVTEQFLNRLRENQAVQERVNLAEANAMAARTAEEAPPIHEPQRPGPPMPTNAVTEQFLAQVRSSQPSAPVSNIPAVNKWLGVQPKDLKFGADPAGEITKRGLLGETHEATLKNVSPATIAIRDTVAQQLDAAGRRGARINAWDSINELLDKTRSPIASPTDAAFRHQLNEIGNKIIDRFPNLDNLTPTEAQNLKVELTNHINYNSSMPSEVTAMLKKMGHDVSEKIKSAVPETRSSYDSWQNLIIAERGLKNQIAAVKAGRSIKSLAETQAARLRSTARGIQPR